MKKISDGLLFIKILDFKTRSVNFDWKANILIQKVRTFCRKINKYSAGFNKFVVKYASEYKV